MPLTLSKTIVCEYLFLSIGIGGIGVSEEFMTLTKLLSIAYTKF